MGYKSERLFEKCINILIFTTAKDFDSFFQSVAVLWLLPPTNYLPSERSDHQKVLGAAWKQF